MYRTFMESNCGDVPLFSRHLHVIASSFDWFIVLFPSLAIGQIILWFWFYALMSRIEHSYNFYDFSLSYKFYEAQRELRILRKL